MSERLEYWKLGSEAVAGLMAVSKAVGAALPAGLVNLINLRVSQINGCAYCLDLHTREAERAGEASGRLAVVAAWRETTERFTGPERAALAWAEVLTRLPDGGSPEHAEREAALAEVRRHFDEKQAVHLCMAVAAINAFNRVAVGCNKSLPAMARAE